MEALGVKSLSSTEVAAIAPNSGKGLLEQMNLPFFIFNCYAVQDFHSFIASAESFRNYLTKTTDSREIHAGMGLSSFLNFGVGVAGLFLQAKNYFKAKKIGDTVGQIFAGMLTVRFTNTIISGITGLASRVITMIQFAGSSGVVSILGHVGGAFGALSYTIISIPYIFKGIKALVKLNQFDKSETVSYEVLKKELEISPEEFIEVLSKVNKSDTSQDELSGEDKDVIAHVLTPEEHEKWSYLNDNYKLALAHKKLVKEEAFKRIYGNEALEALKDGTTQAEVVQLAKKGVRYQAAMNFLKLVAAATSITAFVLGIIGTGGTLLLASLVVSLGAAALWVASDSTELAAEWKKGVFCKKDRIIMGIFTMMITAMVVVSSVMSVGLVPMLISTVGGSALLAAQIAFTVIASKQAEKKAPQVEAA